jgi:hypothetical protein
MKSHLLPCSCIVRRSMAAGCLALAAVSPAFASPGAHGPNGEHLDAAVQAHGAAGSVPRIEAKSEDFELVGRLQGGELTMFINRFATNEPVAEAKVEVELGNLKATAPFHSDQGDYAVADEAFLKAVSKPGDHSLVITVVAGPDADLLEGTLQVKATADDHGHGVVEGLIRLVLLVTGFILVGTIGWMLGRRKAASTAPLAVGGAR